MRAHITMTSALLLGAVLHPAAAQAPAPAASGQAYPVKPVRVIASSSPCSAVDIVARIVAQKLT